ncbi:glycosyltransferase family 2 protein [Streptomyces gibsoniae]|uniref:Glycosyltransferase family 2 protein n=1 Tax=Streptomyces gibsoniae TaxID=3075529 RepID=A0ABU2TMH4_9ACTN|nr:glycosyltransferase family 2 protein [Streptomyces sp. DSM 41699]MDT0462139.1 glycosyltransferase family 2 protein [Streptomyces sp. DSM 41699]
MVAVLPAHNEQSRLGVVIESVRAQHRPVSRIIVIPDRCTDRTADIARRHGCQVIETVGNKNLKAGALNQVLPKLLDTLDEADLLLIMDADSTICPEFTAVAHHYLHARPEVAAIGGVFYGQDGAGLLGALQRNEYARYAREVARRKARATVLTGTASVFRASVLRAVAAARGTRLPGPQGCVYHPAALTEDNEITLAVKHLGWVTLSPRRCRVVTEIMPTWRDFVRQRLRWQRGALENLQTYGLTRVTLPYILKQCSMYFGIVAVSLMLLTSALFVYLGLYTAPRGWLWIPLAVFTVERIWTVRRQGLRAMVLAALLVLEFAYDGVQQRVYLRAVADVTRRKSHQWHHLAGEER